jgi:K+-sensing histidine kinase KdpD
MFFPWYKFCCNSESEASMTWRQRRLKFLKSIRDDLETRLAAINAAIESIERQEERG